MSRYAQFARAEIGVEPLAVRGHQLHALDCKERPAPRQLFSHPDLAPFVDRVLAARQGCRPVILMMGGHPIKLGLSSLLIDLMEAGFITHIATNGAGIIHDFELALVGGTSEDVAKWIASGNSACGRRPAGSTMSSPRRHRGAKALAKPWGASSRSSGFRTAS